MTAAPFDPVQYKASQRQDWSSVAAGWRQWWKTLERGAQAVSDRLVELAEVRPGQRVLDIATGIGEPAVTAAHRVGPQGRVVALDQAPQMLAIARERAAELGLSNIEFHEADAEALSLPADSFEAILCRWGLMFLPNLPAALGKMRALLAPTGRVAAAVWGPPPTVPMISLAMGTVRQLLQAPPPPPGVPGPFSLADPTLLERALATAGFSRIRTERMAVTFEWASAADYARFHQAVSAPIQALLAGVPTEQRDTIWQAVTDAARQYAGADGAVRMTNDVICVAARR